MDLRDVGLQSYLSKPSRKPENLYHESYSKINELKIRGKARRIYLKLPPDSGLMTSI